MLLVTADQVLQTFAVDVEHMTVLASLERQIFEK